jgi:hypothetical protein
VDVAGERDRIAAVLAAGGVASSGDPGAVHPPCVVVGLPSVDTIDDVYAVIRTPVYVVAPGPAGGDAVARMLADLGAVTMALGDPPAVPGLAGLPAQNASGYTVTVARRTARNLCP